MNPAHLLLTIWRLAGIALIGLALTAAPAAAELPPSVYADMQHDAPEALKIEITSINARSTRIPGQRGLTYQVSAEAKVLEVKRSASGLKAGQKIRLSYTHFVPNELIVGPSEPPIVKHGRIYPAFLKPGETPNTYAPAAGGYSFEVVDAEPTSDEETM